ncbi:hypothetical protein R1sor_009033 [Riccia sorocarpa]|uniref:Uncharacterized protein n=1 Tax=Riccia sorocarpa TaxID=122646 RepID=A0ABD3H7F6_9MARC
MLTYCHAMLSMWRAKHRWFQLEETELAPTFPIKDWWDGTKAKEVSWFWDSETTWELPVACSLCLEVYQTFPSKCQELLTSLNITSGIYDFICRSCGTRVTLERATCARNSYAFLPGDCVCLDRVSEHLDGRDEDSKCQCQLAIAAYARIVHPQYQRGPVTLNACLQPFIEELIDLFINGVEVEFNYPSELIGGRDLPKRFTLWIMLVLFTGDHPAQCKFGGFATSGYSGCRRCKMRSIVCNVPNSRVVVYDSNREQYRHPSARKTVSELREAAVGLNACVTGAARKELSQRTGVTGDSQVWKLFDLYGFNSSEDLTYGAMHVLAHMNRGRFCMTSGEWCLK